MEKKFLTHAFVSFAIKLIAIKIYVKIFSLLPNIFGEKTAPARPKKINMGNGVSLLRFK